MNSLHFIRISYVYLFIMLSSYKTSGTGIIIVWLVITNGWPPPSLAQTPFKFHRCTMNHLIVSKPLTDDFVANMCANETNHLIFVKCKMDYFPMVFKFYPIRTLTAVHAGLTKIDPDTFSEAHNLTALYLAVNEFLTITDEMFRGAKHLTHLDLSHCSIVNITEKSFVGLNSLLSLDLTGNMISVIPIKTFVCLTSLTMISLADNQFKILPAKVFASNKLLTSIDLSHSSQLLHLHYDAFVGCAIEELNLNDSPFVFNLASDSIFTESIRKLSVRNTGITHLIVSPHVELIDASHNEITSIEPYYEDSMQSALTRLQINGNKFHNFRQLKYFQKMRTLLLSDNRLKTFEFDIPLTSLEQLYVARNPLVAASIDVKQLAVSMPKLLEIYVSQNNWTNDFMMQLNESFQMERIQFGVEPDHKPEQLHVNSEAVVPMHGEKKSDKIIYSRDELKKLAALLNRNEDLSTRIFRMMTAGLRYPVGDNIWLNLLIWTLAIVSICLVCVGIVAWYQLTKRFPNVIMPDEPGNGEQEMADLVSPNRPAGGNATFMRRTPKQDERESTSETVRTGPAQTIQAHRHLAFLARVLPGRVLRPRADLGRAPRVAPLAQAEPLPETPEDCEPSTSTGVRSSVPPPHPVAELRSTPSSSESPTPSDENIPLLALPSTTVRSHSRDPSPGQSLEVPIVDFTRSRSSSRSRSSHHDDPPLLNEDDDDIESEL